MIKTIPLHGVSLSGANGLPTVASAANDPASQAIGGIPGWKVFIDPSEGTASSLPNLARANSVFTPLTGSFEYDDLGPGLDTYLSDDWANAADKRLTAPVGINPTAWTFFYVLNTTSVGVDGNRVLAKTNSGVPGGSEGIEIRIDTSNGLRLIRTTGTTLVASGALVNDTTVLIMATFSTRDGTSLRKNGAEIAANSADLNPLTFEFGPQQWGMLRTPFGEFGMMGLLDIDLSWPENAGYRRALETYLINRYGIA